MREESQKYLWLCYVVGEIEERENMCREHENRLEVASCGQVLFQKFSSSPWREREDMWKRENLWLT
jgi:hypothetical protein